MSLATLEKAIWREAQKVLNNPKMKLKELLEWSTGSIKPQDGEIVVSLPESQCNVAVPASCDKRVK